MSKEGWLLVAIGAVAILALGGGQAAVDATVSAINTMTGRLTADQILQFAANAGFAGESLVDAVAIALAESSGNPKAHGDVGIGEGSFGLWQVNSYYHPEFGPDFTKLFDPQTNANAAFSIYVAAGSRFSPWSTFKNGAYLAHLDAAQAASDGSLNA